MANQKISVLKFSKQYAQSKMTPFTCDDIKSEWLKIYPEPQNKNIFGAVMKWLSDSGLIKFNGEYIKSKFPAARGRMIKQWISKQYSEKQQANRKIAQPELNFGENGK